MLTIHFSNRLETLEQLLQARLRACAAGDVFAAPTVIVPSAAMQRRLTLAVAREQGVCANIEFAYLARWLWGRIAQVVPGVAAESPFDAALLVWRIHAALSDPHWSAPHPRLARYLSRADTAMRYELADRLAVLFEQYVTYRPDWLAAWTRGAAAAGGAAGSVMAQDEAWQAALWRRIAPAEAASPAEAFVAALRARGAAWVAEGSLPAEIQVFALPAIAPLHLALLQALGGCAEVHLYALNPCREYWFDCVDARRLAWLAARGRATPQHEVGNRLLAAWGRQTQSQLALLVDACGESGVDDARFDDDDRPSLLARWQRSMLELRELAPGALAADDRSVEFHVCHSLAREIEVLHDRLLGLFARDESLTPGDILVVTPDLEAAAPLVEAIFGTAPAPRYIAYQVTGRPRARANAAARVLVELLELAASRCAASAVYGLLQRPPVARRFGLGADALERIHAWLLQAGAHWALDEAHCADLGLPAEGRHSFADAIERLLLGYALPDDAATPFAGTLACGAAEGSTDAVALGALWRFVEALAELRRDIGRAPLAPSAWAERLPRALGEFFAPADDEIEELQEVNAALARLAGRWARSGCDDALDLAVVRSAVAAALEDPARGGVPGGGVTFASLSALRGLPFRVVCAIGMNDGAFPSVDRPAEFDLMRAAPEQARSGDRLRRDDDRNVLLDLLLAAREVVHLSYVGRSVRDNARLPPSVLLSELQETLLVAIDGAGRERLVVLHPLQAFSAEALGSAADPRRRSFQAEYAQALRRRLEAPVALAASGAADDEDDGESGTAPAQPFFARALAAPGDEWLEVSIDRLLAFLRQPCRYLLHERLRLRLPRPADELDDDEAFAADLPARSALAARLLPAALAGADREALHTLAVVGREWPAGAVAASALAAELDALAAFADRLRGPLAEPLRPPLAASIELDAAGRRWRVHGNLVDLRASGLLRYRYDELRAGDALAAWLAHLLLCCATPTGAARRTTLVARDRTLVLAPCATAREQIARLVELYAQGLVVPLPFFPKTAWAYALARPEAKVSAARAKWRQSQFAPHAESADASIGLALRGRPDPLADDALPAFASCAEAVFAPLLECVEAT